MFGISKIVQEIESTRLILSLSKLNNLSLGLRLGLGLSLVLSLSLPPAVHGAGSKEQAPAGKNNTGVKRNTGVKSNTGGKNKPADINRAAGSTCPQSELDVLQKQLSDGQLMTARKSVEELLAKYPHDPAVALLSARLYSRMGLSALAIIQFERVRRSYPYMVEPMIALARLHLENLSTFLAVNLAEDAVHIEPSNKEAQLVLVDALISNQSLRRARQQANKLLDLYPNDAQVLHANAEVSQAEGDLEKAQRFLEVAASRAPERLSWQIELAGLYQSLGNFSAARASYDEILKNDPGDLEALSGLAHLYEFDLNDFLRARNVYERILKIIPDDPASLAGMERCQTKQSDLALWLRGLIYRTLGQR